MNKLESPEKNIDRIIENTNNNIIDLNVNLNFLSLLLHKIKVIIYPAAFAITPE